jgi:hypothetical protein
MCLHFTQFINCCLSGIHLSGSTPMKSSSTAPTATAPEDMSKDQYDERPLIGDLLKKHASEIESVRKIIEGDPLYKKGNNSSLYDDIWILRFLLSHKNNVESASKAAVKTMHFRYEHKLNELGDIRHKVVSSMTCLTSDHFPATIKFISGCTDVDTLIFTLPDKNRGILNVVRFAHMDLKKIDETMSAEELQENYMYANESVYQILDDITRRTGKLTKLLRVVDLEDTSIRNVNISYLQKDGAAGKMTEDHYPQMLGALVVCNCPGWVTGMWTVLRNFFPSPMVEKISFMGKKIRSENVKFWLKYVSLENLPVKLGGRDEKWPDVEDLAETVLKMKAAECDASSVYSC